MKHRNLTSIAIAIGLGLGTLGLASCSQDYKGLGDAGIGHTLEAKREVIVMPDGFANVAMACDGHGNRVFVTTRDAASVIVADPTCR